MQLQSPNFERRVVLVETVEAYASMKQELVGQRAASIDSETSGLEALELWQKVAEANREIEVEGLFLERVQKVYKARYKQGRRRGYEAGGLKMRAYIAELKDRVHQLEMGRNADEREAKKNPGGLQFNKNVISCLQIGTDHRLNNGVCTAYIIRPHLVEPEWFESFVNGLDTVYFHNAKFDLKEFIYHWKVQLIGDNLVDTQAREYVRTMGRKLKIGLKDCAERHLGVVLDKTLRLFNYCGSWTEEAIEYAANDVFWLPDIARSQDKDLTDRQLTAVYREQDLSLVLAEMEIYGVGINKDLAEVARDSAKAEYDQLVDKVKGLLPGLDNPNSPTQLLEYLNTHKKLNLKSTDKKALAKFEGLDYIDAISEMKSFGKLLKTYYAPLAEGCVEQPDGTWRIHANYNSLNSGKSESDAGTDTTRLSSSDPNLQNQPGKATFDITESEEIKTTHKLREIFVPRPGFKLAVCDLNQIEPRIAAYVAQEPTLIRIFEDGIDPYCMMAERMYGIPWKEVYDSYKAGHSERRDEMKIALLSIMLYCKTDFGCAKDYPHLFPTRQAARSFISKLEGQFIAWKRFKAMTISHARRGGYVETITGRKRYLPDITSAEKWLREKAERQAVNTRIQSPAADGMKETLIMLRREIRDRGLQDKIFIVLTVHDEVVLEALDDEEVLANAVDILESCMIEGTGQFLRPTREYPVGVPVTAKAIICETWGGAK